MKHTLALALVPFYLSCAAPKEPVQVPVFEIPYSPATKVKEVENIKRPPKSPPAKEASDFIVKRLEELIKENPGTMYARGEMSPLYWLNYKFDPAYFCEVGSDEQFSKGALFVDFKDIKYVVNGNGIGTSISTSIHFETGSPFYAYNILHFHSTEFPANGPINERWFYPFPEAQKMYEEILLCIAEELKQEPLEIEVEGEGIVIQHPARAFGNREANVYKNYVDVIDALPKQSPYPPEARFSLIETCKKD